MDNSNELYDQIYLFFKKENSTKLIYYKYAKKNIGILIQNFIGIKFYVKMEI